jgi:hypothetical protein
MSKLIPLHNRKGDVVAHAIVDDADFEWLSQWKWHVTTSDGKIRYVARHAARDQGRTGKRIYMHKVILGIEHGQGDHINRNKLDNRRLNLRMATPKQNYANRGKPQQLSSSQYKGVHFDKKCNKWRARITTDNLGYFTNEFDAARAYDAAAPHYFGEFAQLNFPQETQP